MPAEHDGMLSYDGAVAVEIPNGPPEVAIEIAEETVTLRALPLADAMGLMRLMHAAGQGDANATLEFLDTFPAAVAPDGQLDGLMPAEVFDVAQRFFTARRRTARKPTAPTTESR